MLPTTPATTPTDVVVSFDTTGSMYPCLSEVRHRIEDMVKKLFHDIPNLRVGIIAHGDYCDEGSTYVTSIFAPTDDQNAIINFVKKVGKTGGGDSPECYELVLHHAYADIEWRSDASKVLVLIGDDVPHGPREPQNYLHLDWRKELDTLLSNGIKVYGIQAMARKHANFFYQEIAAATGGVKLTLNQFGDAVEIVMAVCYKQSGDEQLEAFGQQLQAKKKLNKSIATALAALGSKTAVAASATYASSGAGLSPVPAHRFQVLHVGDKNTGIKEFVQSNGAAFKVGRGFYQLTKSELVQEKKEVVLRDKLSGDFFTGDDARHMIGLEVGERAKVKPVVLDKYDVFIQSTSANRVLMSDTLFLYEVDGWDC